MSIDSDTRYTIFEEELHEEVANLKAMEGCDIYTGKQLRDQQRIIDFLSRRLEEIKDENCMRSLRVYG